MRSLPRPPQGLESPGTGMKEFWKLKMDPGLHFPTLETPQGNYFQDPFMRCLSPPPPGWNPRDRDEGVMQAQNGPLGCILQPRKPPRARNFRLLAATSCPDPPGA